jgi:NAD(P)-dependent dehydrogenase (short-subunit alcohol dehydrogenase family)
VSAPDVARLDAVPDYLARLRLDGRGFVVLGAGAGMGRQSAHALAQAGARVACVDRSAELAEAVAGELEGATAIAADVTDRADVERVFAAAAARLGPLTGIVDVVGMATIGPLADLDDAAWDRQFDLVLRHAFLVLQVGAAALREAGGGTIVFVGSISGHRWVPDQAAYGAAKASLHHLVQAMGGELAADGIRVNAVAPGWVRTPRLVEGLGEDAWSRIDAVVPRGSAALPAEIAGPLLFLSGELSSYVTGHVLVADGGLTAGSPHPQVFD